MARDAAPPEDRGPEPGAAVISGRPRFDRTVIRFTLGSNPRLLSSMEPRPRPHVPGGAPVLAIICFSGNDRARVDHLLREVGLTEDPDIVIITVP